MSQVRRLIEASGSSRHLLDYGLLVVNEVGYPPLERQAANLLVALASRRCERGSIIISSNRGYPLAHFKFPEVAQFSVPVDSIAAHARLRTARRSAGGWTRRAS